MFHGFLSDASFWMFLFAVDHDLAEKTRSGACPHCGGALHRADYARKPRGVPDSLPGKFRYRLSFTCAREGCRRRQTPPSVRFLGRRVYPGAIVVLATAMRQGPTPRGLRALARLFGADRRTIRRWQSFWEEFFPKTRFWRGAKANFPQPPDETSLPRSFFSSFAATSLREKLLLILRFLAPTTVPGALGTTAPEWS